MVNREQLRAGGLRAYERGRLKMAGRVAYVLVPLVALCALLSGAQSGCACLGTLLLGVAVLLRWRDRRGVESVATGLVAGSAPLVVGLVVARVVPGACADAPLLSACTLISLIVGGAAGVSIGTRAAARGAGLARTVVAVAVAALAASLGCVSLGLWAVLGAAVGLLGGSAVGRLSIQAEPR